MPLGIINFVSHRPEDKPTPDRFSSHDADTVALALHPDGKRAIHLDAMRKKVVQWKSRFFGSSWARYDLAAPGSFRLVPSKVRVDALRQATLKRGKMQEARRQEILGIPKVWFGKIPMSSIQKGISA